MSTRRHVLRKVVANAGSTLALVMLLSPVQAAEPVLRVGVQPTLNDIWAGVAGSSVTTAATLAPVSVP